MTYKLIVHDNLTGQLSLPILVWYHWYPQPLLYSFLSYINELVFQKKSCMIDMGNIGIQGLLR